MLASAAKPSSPPGDPLAEAARAACRGDAAATHQLLTQLARAVLPVLRMLLGPRHPDLEDLLQDSLIGALRGLPTFRWESTVAHYARRVALRRGLEFRRRSRTAASTLEQVRVGEPQPAGASPHDEAIAERWRHHLRALLGELSEPQALALTMRAVLGYSIEEIAEATEVPVNTVRSRLRLAKEALRQRIEADPQLADLDLAEVQS